VPRLKEKKRERGPRPAAPHPLPSFHTCVHVSTTMYRLSQNMTKLWAMEKALTLTGLRGRMKALPPTTMATSVERERERREKGCEGQVSVRVPFAGVLLSPLCGARPRPARPGQAAVHAAPPTIALLAGLVPHRARRGVARGLNPPALAPSPGGNGPRAPVRLPTFLSLRLLTSDGDGGRRLPVDEGPVLDAGVCAHVCVCGVGGGVWGERAREGE